MAKLIEKSALEFFSDVKAAQNLINEHNDLVRSHNELCQAHDELVQQFLEVSTLVDTLMDVVFENSPQELDS